ncbi:Flp family type IVb pilin [Vibrio mexicanus]|uniref:Flp family type IVb pilin n=1 Tax=Vibrio mexicanus TaxID=1004326 RepID=UPI000AC5D57A|nr:Flp family type IVb pilin [Vibrio mexicanus]
MNIIIKRVRQFYSDETGLTVVEYVVGAALLLGAMTVFFQGWETGMSGALATALQGIYE